MRTLGLGKLLGKGLGKVSGARFPVMRTAAPGPSAATRTPADLPVATARGHQDETFPSRRAVVAPRRPQQHTHGLVGALNAEWQRIVLDPDARAMAATWSITEPALAGRAGPAAVLDAVTRGGHDDVLLALLRLARDGDALAARTALQAMLGAAVRLARRTLGHAQGDLEESLSRAVTALWQVVSDYPVERRTCRPADGISLDVLAALTATGRTRPSEVPGGLAAELADVPEEQPDDLGLRSLFWAVAYPAGADACSDEQLLLLLAWGVRRGVVSADDARLLLRLHSPREPGAAVSCRQVAHELGLGHAALRQRASRATRRLANAVAHHVDAGLQDFGIAA
jgi:hypothetical protein